MDEQSKDDLDRIQMSGGTGSTVPGMPSGIGIGIALRSLRSSTLSILRCLAQPSLRRFAPPFLRSVAQPSLRRFASPFLRSLAHTALCIYLRSLLAVFLWISFFILGPSLRAEGATPLQISVFSPVQLFDSSQSVYGLRTNLIYGHSRAVYGLDLGLFNRVDRLSAGLQVGLMNLNHASRYGLSLGLVEVNGEDSYGLSLHLWSDTKKDVHGLQMGLLYNEGQSFRLPQIGGWNVARSAPLQLGFYNEVQGGSPLLQAAGLFNDTPGSTLFQFSAMGNRADGGSFLQIGGLFNLAGSLEKENRPSDYLEPIAQISAFYNEAHEAMLQFGAMNINDKGLLVQAGFYNYVRDPVFFQIGVRNGSEHALLQIGLLNYSTYTPFFQAGLFNYNGGGGAPGGLGLGLVNHEYYAKGIRIAFVNRSFVSRGLNFGILNYSEKLRGLQFGLININSSGAVPVMIGINAGGR